MQISRFFPLHPNNNYRHNLEHGQLYQVLKSLPDLEELYLMGFPGHHYEVGESDAPLLQTFEKLRVAVVDIHTAPVRSLLLLKETEHNKCIHLIPPARSSRSLLCFLYLQLVCSRPSQGHLEDLVHFALRKDYCCDYESKNCNCCRSLDMGRRTVLCCDSLSLLTR